MKIAIAGMGAVGALMAARLAQVGADVSALARGATLAALQAHGVRVRQEGGVAQAPLRAAADAAALGIQDAVIVAVKATAMRELAPQLAPLIGPHTMVVSAMNGVP
ncbi:Ketopantoate reductase PanE/ApbA [Noviherbaspirillum humi]|uniref:Ketopantoate reductase PanE/ApbA n=1 Tax=Noviherbaspirillum humi TaxID=1688639 RepID=A0A239C4N5_9BURK|nr:Ketopantoate reductase PanE/ApbA [Noviherbaspirillum humi]